MHIAVPLKRHKLCSNSFITQSQNIQTKEEGEKKSCGSQVLIDLIKII